MESKMATDNTKLTLYWSNSLLKTKTIDRLPYKGLKLLQKC